MSEQQFAAPPPPPAQPGPYPGAQQAPVQAPPPPPGYGYGFPPPQQKTNTMAILGLVFAFVFSPLGIVFSALGLKQTKQRGEGGRGLAVAGLIISIIFTVLGLIWLILVVTVLSSAVRTAGALDSAASSASRALASEGAALNASGNPRVAAACLAIMPTLATAGSDLGSGQSAQDYQAEIATMTQALQAAATTSGDKTFTVHVQKLVDDLRALSTAVSRGQDPSRLEDALAADGDALDQDCSAK